MDSIEDKEEIKQHIREIVDKYERVVEERRLSKYNEEMTKKDFILPLFRELGWNVEDSSEVTAEEKISKGRVDYGFRINGIPKFYLEAKALKVDIDNPKFVEQAINYAWHKGCTWAVLTNFKVVKIFNAEWKTTNPLQTHLKTISYYEFFDRFEELWLLSKESFEKGLLDKEAEKWGKKAKRVPIDKQLLSDFTKFRELLSKNITKLNRERNLTEEELDESVQRILDRLIFIRSCEDRELESKKLISTLREWESKGKGKLIKYVRQVFSYFDEQYNSKIFSEHLCDSLDIDNYTLSEVINGLYQTKNRVVSYDFSAIEADVLGNIYEQYLGHILKKTAKRATVKDSHKKRKEQGIYYTPTYIVDYIVRNTLGELLKKKKPEQVEKIRVLDPACGSGSFLIKAFDVLNEYYSKKDKNYSQTQLDLKTGIPFTKKVKILKNNIFGVDLDKQAVEIAQLNLLLKIAEKGHRLPLLKHNIKCGNSLISNKEIAGEKALEWEEEFKEIIDEGGFDVVIGNPPYVSVKILPQLEKDYYTNVYYSAKGQFDLYGLFIEKSIMLLKEGGYFGFITSNTFLSNKDFKNLREFILNHTKIRKIIDLRETVFKDANLDVSIIILEKCLDGPKRNKNKILVIDNPKKFRDGVFIKISQSEFIKQKNYEFKTHFDHVAEGIISKLSKDSITLGSVVKITRGIEKGSNECIICDVAPSKPYVPILVGKDISRYNISFNKRYVKYDESNKSDFKTREIFESDKLLVQRIRNLSLKRRLVATMDVDNFYTMNTLRIILAKDYNFDLRYLLALINSKAINYYFLNSFNNKDIYAYQLKQIPIKQISKLEQQPVIQLVDKMLYLNKHLSEIGDKKTDERARIEEEIKKTDAEIDEFVYKIYGITEKEKKIIEENI